MSVQHTVTGLVAPIAPPPSIGAHYINTATGDQYLAKGTATVNDWVLMAAKAQAAWPPYLDKALQDADYSNKSLPTIRYGALVNGTDTGSAVHGVNVYRFVPERDLLINRLTYGLSVQAGAGTAADTVCGVVYGSDANGMPGDLLGATPAQDLTTTRNGGALAGAATVAMKAGKTYWIGTHINIVTPGVDVSFVTVATGTENIEWYIYGLYSYDALWADMDVPPGSTPANWSANIDKSPINLALIPVVGIGEKNI